MRPVTLFYLDPSHYCEKARAILRFKKIPFKLVRVPYGDHSAVIEASGQDYVPYVKVPGARGVTWPHVADWAEDVAPEPTLFPDGASRAECRLIENWAHQVVEEMAWRYAVADVPRVIRDPKERWVFVEMQERKRGPLEMMKKRQKEFLGGLKEVCGLAEGLLDGKPFLLASQPSLADFALFGALLPLPYSRNRMPREFARLRRWHERVARIAR